MIVSPMPRRPTFLLAALPSLFGSQAAFAQSEQQAQAIPEITVTAQRRREPLQEVPISIQAVSGETLNARGIETISGLGPLVPGLVFNSLANYDLVSLRGIGKDNFIPSADSSVATYLDGIYVPLNHSVTQQVANIDHVEVLKGPQGTLFGRNSTAGAINVVTREPPESSSIYSEAEAGSFNLWGGKASVGGPVTDWLSFNAAGFYRYQDSYITNVNYQVEPDRNSGARVKLRLQPLDNLSLDLVGDYSHESGVGGVIIKNLHPSLLGRAIGIRPQADDYVGVEDAHADNRAHDRIDYAILTWKLPWFITKLLGSDQNAVTTRGIQDFDGSPVPAAAFKIGNEFSRLQTGELQLLSNDDAPLSQRFKWVSGLYWYVGKAGYDPAFLEILPNAFNAYLNILGLSLPPALNDLVAKLPLAYTPLDQNGLSVKFDGVLGTRSYSAYAQGTYFFADWLDLSLGGRLQTEKRFLINSDSSALAPITGTPVPLLPFQDQEHTASNFSPRGVLSLHPSKTALLYASFSQGFKSGTYNIVNIYLQPNYVEPERATAYELGFKLDLLGNRLRLNGALFDTEISKLQTGIISILSGGAVRLQNAGHARSRGLELDSAWIPLPVIDRGLRLRAGLSWMDARYTDFQHGAGFDPGTGLYNGNLDFSGNQMVRAPRFSGNLGLSQNIRAGDGLIELAVDEYYNSGFYYDPQNSVHEAPYAVLDAHASYLYKPWSLRATVYGSNLLDRRYHNVGGDEDFGSGKALAPPREWGGRLSWEF